MDVKHLSWIFCAALALAGCSLERSYDGGYFSANGDADGDSDEVRPGLLTAGAWDDNLNFDFYLDYLELHPLSAVPSIPRADRVEISVVDELGRPVAGATVSFSVDGELLFEALTGGEGRVLFFPAWAGEAQGAEIDVQARLADSTASTVATAGSSTLLLLPGHEAAPVEALDLAFVIDSTGSMDDEISYLKVEIDAIASALHEALPLVDIRWALVVYRDTDDDYVVREFDFTASVEEFRNNLSRQQAEGGGDYPEAIDRALETTAGLSWRSGATSRVAFFIADAPHHSEATSSVTESLADLRDLSVHLYPVASSGVDDQFEHTFRTAAQVTGGRYLFLTDDSGVGGSHLEPTVPCYFVTLLSDAIVRMVTIEVAGEYFEPPAEEIIRTGGDPTDGACTLGSGEEILVF